MPAPLLVTVTSNPMVCPAETGPAGLADLAMSMAVPWCSTEAQAVHSFPTRRSSDLVLDTGESGGVAEVVGEEMCTVNVAPEARSTGPHTRARSEEYTSALQ